MPLFSSSLTFTGNGRGLSTDLWNGFDVTNTLVARNENVGFGIKPNFASIDFAVDAAAPTVLYGPDGARCYKDANMTVDQYDIMGGALRISGATQHEEAWVQWGGGDGAPFVISDTAAESRDLIFEIAWRSNYSASFADHEIFLGLAEKGAAAADFIADGGGLAAKSLIGFHQDGGSHIDWAYRKNGQALQVHNATWQSLANNTWYHAGFKFDASTLTITPWFGTGDRTTVAMASDNTSLIPSTVIDDATFPDSDQLAPIVGLKCIGAAVGGDLDVRLLACAQLAPAAD